MLESWLGLLGKDVIRNTLPASSKANTSRSGVFPDEMNAQNDKDSFAWHAPFFALRKGRSYMDAFCLDVLPMPALVDRIEQAMRNESSCVQLYNEPFLLYSIVFSEWYIASLRMFWNLRTRIAATEDEASRGGTVGFRGLHDLAKHVSQMSGEVVNSAIELLKRVMEDHEVLSFNDPVVGEAQEKDFIDEMRLYCRDNLRAVECHMKGSRAGFLTLEKRVQNQINLSFNLATQRDSRIARQIADATRLDSIAMRTISILTLIFLPGTAVAVRILICFSVLWD